LQKVKLNFQAITVLFPSSDQSTAEKRRLLKSDIVVLQTVTNSLYYLSKRCGKPKYDWADQRSAFAT